MAFEALKERQGHVWGLGPFELIEATIADMYETLVASLAPAKGDVWLDVGCGTGAVAERAARAGATVTGIDLAPVLVETAAKRAAEHGLEIEYGVGDVEQLPFADASFGVVSSSVGAIFAPDHAATARELARVTKPGGRLGLTAWCPDGRIGDFFRTIATFQPPPEGAGSPLAWGSEAHARELLEGDFELTITTEVSRYEFDDLEANWELFSTAFGPIVALLASQPERADELKAAFVANAELDRVGDRIEQERTYLLIRGTRRIGVGSTEPSAGAGLAGAGATDD
jgi:SAM-dependent methyltransferase